MCYEMVKEGRHDAAFWWSYDTFSNSDRTGLINEGCKDVSKTKVDKIFTEVFGYSSFINPNKYKDLAVCKSNLQSAHDGKIVQCPAKPIKGKIYQRLIDNRQRNNPFVVLDIRVFIGGGIFMVINKYRAIKGRFKDGSKDAKMMNVNEVFTKKAQEKIVEFCDKFGLDFGEIDILRDSDGKIYIIDVNNIAGSGVFGRLSPKEALKAQQIYYNEFKKICKLKS